MPRLLLKSDFIWSYMTLYENCQMETESLTEQLSAESRMRVLSNQTPSPENPQTLPQLSPKFNKPLQTGHGSFNSKWTIFKFKISLTLSQTLSLNHLSKATPIPYTFFSFRKRMDKMMLSNCAFFVCFQRSKLSSPGPTKPLVPKPQQSPNKF